MRLKLNATIFACIIWMIVYYGCPYLQNKYGLDKANAIEFWLMADALYFMTIVFTEKHRWTWTLASFLFFSTTNNFIDEMWGSPYTYPLQEKLIFAVCVIASFGIGFLTYKHEPKITKYD